MRALGYGILALSLASGLTACELDETCDPLIDPNCAIGGGDGSGTGGGTGDGTGGGTGDGTGGGTGDGTGDGCPDDCGDGTCIDGACGFTHVVIADTSGATNPPHPGSDIDAIELRSGGQSFYATSPTDSLIPPELTNDASDPTQVAGPPQLPGEPFACDVDAATEHWTSLAGGYLVVEFGVAIRPGDEIIVYECPGVSDTYDVQIGSSARADAPGAQFTTLLQDASGVSTAVVPALP